MRCREEAYTFAAAVTLESPAASNDFAAIQTLEAPMQNLPCPVLRGFDLLVFTYLRDAISLKKCEDHRQNLIRSGEHAPKAFVHSPFEDGMRGFRCRLEHDSRAQGTQPRTYSGTLVISSN